MGGFCGKCGKPLDEGARFCVSCGTKIEIPTAVENDEKKGVENQSAETIQKTLHVATKLLQHNNVASEVSGETAFAIPSFEGTESVMSAISPFTTLFLGVKRIFSSFTAAFKNKKALIPAIILAVSWIVLTLLPILGVDTAAIKGLSWLTFAQGGLKGGLLGILGGIIGKGMFASFIISMFSGGKPFKKIGDGVKKISSGFHCGNTKDTGVLLLGIGMALVGYNIIAGVSTFIQSMAGISALLLTLRSLGSNGGFMRKFIGGFTAKKGSPVKEGTINRILTGMATGFTSAVALSAINWPYTAYIVGLLICITGFVLVIVGGSKKEVAA